MMKRAKYDETLRGRWDALQLPMDLHKQTFLDVGCWAGGFVRMAADRGAFIATGIDAVYDDEWDESTYSHPGVILYEVMSVFDESYRKLSTFDVVLCSGVMYHVSDPVGLIRRLKWKTKSLCIIETAISTSIKDTPALQYCPDDSFDNNYSNWFLPNIPFLREITKEVGFEIEKMFSTGGGRTCLHLRPIERMSEKNLPRRQSLMPNY